MSRENYNISEGCVTVCDGRHDGDNCNYRPITASEVVALVAKAAALDWLSAKLLSGAWEVLLGIDGRIVIALVPARSSVAAPTLAEAVRLAMDAEGER